MIRVFHNPDGTIAYTIEADETNMPVAALSHIDIEAMPTGDISAYMVDNGALVTALDLTAPKEQAKIEIDTQAGRVRMLYITAVPGQEMVYQQKREEAEAVTANPSIDPALVPHIAQEAALNAITLLDQAAIVLTMADQWKTISASIEVTRLSAKAAVDAATTAAEIEAAKEITW